MKPRQTEREQIENFPSSVLFDLARNEAARYDARKAATAILVDRVDPRTKHPDLAVLVQQIASEVIGGTQNISPRADSGAGRTIVSYEPEKGTATVYLKEAGDVLISPFSDYPKNDEFSDPKTWPVEQPPSSPPVDPAADQKLGPDSFPLTLPKEAPAGPLRASVTTKTMFGGETAHMDEILKTAEVPYSEFRALSDMDEISKPSES